MKYPALDLLLATLAPPLAAHSDTLQWCTAVVTDGGAISRLDAAEDVAKEKRAGLWSNPVPPWEYRKAKSNGGE